MHRVWLRGRVCTWNRRIKPCFVYKPRKSAGCRKCNLLWLNEKRDRHVVKMQHDDTIDCCLATTYIS